MIKFLSNYWKVVLALILLIAAVFTYTNVYLVEKAQYETEKKQLETFIIALENTIKKNMSYADVQEELETNSAQIMASRLDLYKHFPKEMKEEDQIMYVLYLEKIFGTEIYFSFSTAQPITVLRDGSKLMGLTLTVNYETTYQGFLDMVSYLSTDSRVTSVQYASIQYDAAADKAVGNITLLLYLMDSNDLEYLPPEVFEPETGKDNIFD